MGIIDMNKKLWITWERQRRSIELSKALRADFYVIENNSIFRYFVCLYRTINIIRRHKPDILFIQNPSMILAFFASTILKRIFSFYLVIDRHSNFLLTPKKRSFLKEFLFNILSYITIRYADLTIVTNADLAHVVRVLGGNSFVLPDKIPSLSPIGGRYFEGENKILVVSSFAEDEPIKEIWQAFSKDEMSSFSVYMSGNSKKLGISLSEMPSNISLTGFLSENDYIDLLFQVDAVIVLTKMEYTLLCGCYEAISAEKPLITSNSSVLQQLFTEAVFVNNDPNSIAEGVQQIFFELSQYKLKSSVMKKKLTKEWDELFKKLELLINDNGKSQ